MARHSNLSLQLQSLRSVYGPAWGSNIPPLNPSKPCSRNSAPAAPANGPPPPATHPKPGFAIDLPTPASTQALSDSFSSHSSHSPPPHSVLAPSKSCITPPSTGTYSCLSSSSHSHSCPASRTPLFDDVDVGLPDAILSSNLEHSLSNPLYHAAHDVFLQEPPSADLRSSSPLTLGWWRNLPAHRKARIIQAESWPILTPSHPSSQPCPVPNSPTLSCRSCSELSHRRSACPSSIGSYTQSDALPSHPSSPRAKPSLCLFERPRQASISSNLNPLIPAPLDVDELDPLLSVQMDGQENLSQSINDLGSLTGPPATFTDCTPAPDLPTSLLDEDLCVGARKSSLRRRKRREESTKRNVGESLLTKSLTRLSRKLPSLQWGNLAILHRVALGKPVGEEEQGAAGKVEEDEAFPCEAMVEDDALCSRSNALPEVDDQNHIVGLIKSWTFDTIQPQDRSNGTFINDPEMEWSSMMVQLETFSPTKKTLGKRAMRLGKSNAASSEVATMSEKDHNLTTLKAGRRQRKKDVPPQQRKVKVKVVKRLVSNPLHLLQLSLELEMMRKQKIRSPLRQRAVKLIVEKQRIVQYVPSASIRHPGSVAQCVDDGDQSSHRYIRRGRSLLRYEL